MGRRAVPADYCKLRFLRPHAAYRKGDVIDYPRGPGKSLVLAGICELVGQELPLLEAAVVEHRNVETADAKRGRKKR